MTLSRSVTSAIVLAGGLGTRLRSAVPDLPKPMAPVCGRPFLEWLLDYWIGQGISRFVLSVGYKQEIIVEHFGRHYKGAIIEYSNEHIPLGTGGGFLSALKCLKPNSPFLLLNGDTFFEVNLFDLYKSMMSHDADCCISLFKANQENRYMRVELFNNRVINLGSEKARVGDLANGGVYLFSPTVASQLSDIDIGNLPVSLEDNVLPQLLAQNGNISADTFSERFIDIGLPEDFELAQTIFSIKII